jgi:hypothetical protein
MKNIRIEKVGDINFTFPYLEVFLNESKSPDLEICITDEKQLVFKFYASQKDIILEIEEWEYLLSVGKDFVSKVLKDENAFNEWFSAQK